MKLLIGTSGYSYEDWRNVFYPPDLPKGKMLDYYARHFSCVEINSTYYGIPHPKVFFQMQKKTPESFEFVVKVNQETTHKRLQNQAAMKQLMLAVQPLKEAGKFSGFLAQFPYSFKNTQSNRQYLAETRKWAEDYPLFVEFRNWTWNQPEIFEFLTYHQINYVDVDLPELRGLLPPQDIVTSHLGYIRFHGRNNANWWNGTNQTRYDYQYTRQELDDWLISIARILKKSYKSYIFFNNHPQGQALRNAQMLMEMTGSLLDSLEK